MNFEMNVTVMIMLGTLIVIWTNYSITGGNFFQSVKFCLDPVQSQADMDELDPGLS